LATNKSVDDPYTLEQLQGPRINVSLVRPLVDRLYGGGGDISIGECNSARPRNTFPIWKGPYIFELFVFLGLKMNVHEADASNYF
jgi:hypothetical protein